jgi:hypothetical protein
MATFQILGGLSLAIAPFAVIAALLVLSARVQDARARAAARQIALTDAVHREMGAVVAPTVTRPLVGPWQVEIPVPFRRADVVSRVLGIVHDTLGEIDQRAAKDVRIVLTPQAEVRRRAAA